jgi:hypothetical protein
MMKRQFSLNGKVKYKNDFRKQKCITDIFHKAVKNTKMTLFVLLLLFFFLKIKSNFQEATLCEREVDNIYFSLYSFYIQKIIISIVILVNKLCLN